MSNEKNLRTNNFGSRLKQHRVDKGLTGNQMAEIIGISQGSLSEIENGKREPSGKFFYGIATNTDVDIKWLLTGEREAKREKTSEEDFFSELQAWAKEMSGSENIEWMKRQIEAQFPAFKKWKEGKDELQNNSLDFPSSMIA